MCDLFDWNYARDHNEPVPMHSNDVFYVRKWFGIISSKTLMRLTLIKHTLAWYKPRSGTRIPYSGDITVDTIVMADPYKEGTFCVQFDARNRKTKHWFETTPSNRNLWVRVISEHVHGLKTLAEFKRVRMEEVLDPTPHFPQTIVYLVHHAKTQKSSYYANVADDYTLVKNPLGNFLVEYPHHWRSVSEVFKVQRAWLMDQMAYFYDHPHGQESVHFVLVGTELYAFWECEPEP